jgi:ATP-binding cassette, subfamily B, bacterial
MPEASAKPGTSEAAVAPSEPGRPRRRPSFSGFKRLWPYIVAHRGDALLALLFLLISTAAVLAMTGAARLLVDHGIALRDMGELARAFAVLAGVIAILAVSTGLRIYFVSKMSEWVVGDLRKDVYNHVLRLDPTHFLKLRTGEVLSRLTTDMTIVENTSGHVASLTLRNILNLVGALALMVLISPTFAGLVLLLLPFGLTPLLLYRKRVRRLSVHAQDLFAEAIGYAGETIEALETVQAFARETTASARFEKAVENALHAAKARIKARSVMSAMLITVIFGGLLAILFMSAVAVFIHHTMPAGALLQLLVLSMLAAAAVSTLGEVWGEILRAAGAMQRIGELLDAEPGIQSPATVQAMPNPARGEVSFENVSFAYPGREDLPALNGFSLHVRPGERVALVGPSGAGKSTVLRLLLRFYDPTSGVVRIDGIDLRDADPVEVRGRMALVAQDSPLFSDSAADNIRFGRQTATADEVMWAAAAAQASEFLSLLPQGIETPMGERAKTLSGGQRQRLAIARALVRNAPILLLDEATSALDAENERLVQEALREAMIGRTTLVIAHRLATVLEADRIVVMEDGRVVEEGRHADLVAAGGLYAKLAELQFGVADDTLAA